MIFERRNFPYETEDELPIDPESSMWSQVQINDKNILLKTNRLYLLFNIKNYVVREIDFSKIIKGKIL